MYLEVYYIAVRRLRYVDIAISPWDFLQTHPHIRNSPLSEMVLKLLTNSPTHTELPFTRDGPLIKLAPSGSPLAQSCTAFCHAHHLDQVGECVGVWCSTISSKHCQLYKKKHNKIPIARVMTYLLQVKVLAAIKQTPICLPVTVRTITCTHIRGVFFGILMFSGFMIEFSKGTCFYHVI